MIVSQRVWALCNDACSATLYGKVWESNPPQPALRHLPPVLKTGASTGTHPSPSTIVAIGCQIGQKPASFCEMSSMPLQFATSSLKLEDVSRCLESLHSERTQRLMTQFRFARHVMAPVLVLSALILSACQPLTPTPPAAEIATDAAPAAPGPTPVASTMAPAQEASPPASLAIPALGVEIAVAPMGWEIVEIDGQRTTQWVVPEAAAGWAINSARAGAEGNMVIAGHQTRGNAVFAALALGEVAPGEEVIVTDEAGADFTYQVVQVSEPLPLLGATAEESAQAAAYIAPSANARLTLVTGWPADTTTHRIFVVAELTAAGQ